MPNLNNNITQQHNIVSNNHSNTPDLSSLLNLPQFQGLVSLAQTNPALFNQLTNSSYFDVPASSSSNELYIKAEPYIKTESSLMSNIPDAATPNNTPVAGTPIYPSSTTAEELESSLKSLATELGFESDNNTLDYVNMDDFLSTYSKLVIYVYICIFS